MMMFESLFDTTTVTAAPDAADVVLCLLAAVLLGVGTALMYMFRLSPVCNVLQ